MLHVADIAEQSCILRSARFQLIDCIGHFFCAILDSFSGNRLAEDRIKLVMFWKAIEYFFQNITAAIDPVQIFDTASAEGCPGKQTDGSMPLAISSRLVLTHFSQTPQLPPPASS